MSNEQHYHLLAGFDAVNITHEATYDDLDKSIEDFIGLIDNMFSDDECNHETARTNMQTAARSLEFKVIYIGEPGSIHVYWLPCTEDKTTESFHIPIRN